MRLAVRIGCPPRVAGTSSGIGSFVWMVGGDLAATVRWYVARFWGGGVSPCFWRRCRACWRRSGSRFSGIGHALAVRRSLWSRASALHMSLAHPRAMSCASFSNSSVVGSRGRLRGRCAASGSCRGGSGSGDDGCDGCDFAVVVMRVRARVSLVLKSVRSSGVSYVGGGVKALGGGGSWLGSILGPLLPSGRRG